MSTYSAFRKTAPKLATLTLVVVSLAAAYSLFLRYNDRPWTRDGQVRAEIIKIAPRVSGYIVKVEVEDNQFVGKGELLFQIDQSDYPLAVDHAEVDLDQAREEVVAMEAGIRASESVVQQCEAALLSAAAQVDAVQAGVQSAEAGVRQAEATVVTAAAMIDQQVALVEEAKRESERSQKLTDYGASSVEVSEVKAAAVVAGQAQVAAAKAGLSEASAGVARANSVVAEAQAKLVIAKNGQAEARAALVTAKAELDETKAKLGARGDANVRVRSAIVALEEAKLELSRTNVYAPTDGFITNLDVNEGQFVAPGSPIVAFVDSASFRVDGYFQETQLKHIQPGSKAYIRLMNHPDQWLVGEVESFGYAINPPDIATTEGPSGLVPSVEPTFDWVRLAQRVPVRIRITEMPEGMRLVAGTTASIAIEPNQNAHRSSAPTSTLRPTKLANDQTTQAPGER